MKFRKKSRFPMDAVDIGPLQLKARRVEFDLNSTPLHWIPGHAVASHAVSAYHLLFPEVERFFIEAFREALPEVRDPRLRDDILGFIGQETMHANAHEESLGDYFQRNGIDPAPLLEHSRYLLRFAATGEEVTVAADRTALSAILDVRPDATFSCRQGFCRSCAVRVLDGAPDHRSTALSPAELEQGYFLPCVSRSDDCLTLDL
ncbi:metal-dependent hydrolase [Nocardia yunnanensis]|uniref:metal-dependent hydrolase n=1 Tax=Nocardia yunnanensis TaxID=2382165 RepID=UPI001FEAA6C3|nr:metal-dependent hydrolase [Nocardia yunnanensis]